MIIIPHISAELGYPSKTYTFMGKHGTEVTYEINQIWDCKDKIAMLYCVSAYEPERLCDFGHDKDGNLIRVTGMVYFGTNPKKAIDCFKALREYWK